MNNDKAFVLGFTTLAFGMFLGSKWSPDYMEIVSNGNNFLLIVGFGLSLLIGFALIDRDYNKKKEKQDSFVSKTEEVKEK